MTVTPNKKACPIFTDLSKWQARNFGNIFKDAFMVIGPHCRLSNVSSLSSAHHSTANIQDPPLAKGTQWGFIELEFTLLSWLGSNFWESPRRKELKPYWKSIELGTWAVAAFLISIHSRTYRSKALGTAVSGPSWSWAAEAHNWDSSKIIILRQLS